MTKATLEQQLEEASRRIDELTAKLERAYPTPAKPKNESVETYLKMAWSRMKTEPEPIKAAANLFTIWSEQDSQVRESLRPIIEEAIETRLAEYEAAEGA